MDINILPLPPLRLRLCFIAGLLLIMQAGMAQADKMTVAVSIKPLHSLISGLLDGTGNEPSLILAGASSPHAYSLKPSDARKLNAARIIFWIGPGLESFLEKPLQSLAGTSTVVTFVTDKNANPHIWLSPIEARQMVDLAVTRLIDVDPDHQDIYRRNGSYLKKRLDALQAELKHQLQGVKSKPFLVYHDAYDPLAKAFDLVIADMVVTNPQQSAGARHIAVLRKRMAAGEVSCLFAEPQVDNRRLNMIIENIKGAKIGILDPLGADLPPGKDMYFALMRQNVRALVDCLSDR